MSESQSRYSIVERLTQRKLDIISSKSDLEEEIKKKKQYIDQTKKEIKDFESDVKQETEKTKRILQRKVEEAEISYKNAVDRKETKKKAYDEKLSALDNALLKIEEVSKAAGQSTA